MQIFSREIMNYIDNRFQLYYRTQNKKMSLADANMLINYVSGPAPIPHELRASDFAQPRVIGGGKTRPSKSQIDLIIDKAEKKAELDSKWASVFDELILRCKDDSDAVRIIELTFKERLYDNDICEILSISRTTFYEYRAAILSRAGILAVQSGILKF